MNNQFISIDFAGSKRFFMAKLNELMRTSQFCGDKAIDFKRIAVLMRKLEDNISFVFEYPYV
jgi:hypothetical protein